VADASVTPPTVAVTAVVEVPAEVYHRNRPEWRVSRGPVWPMGGLGVFDATGKKLGSG
jgi:hypothetical protein